MKKQTETLALRIDADTRAKLDQLSKREQSTRSAVVRRLINQSYARSAK